MNPAPLFEEVQQRYWSGARFRAPDDPIVAAYADPKIDYLQKQVPFAGKRVLDVGCGNGIFTTRLAGLAGLVVGVDLSSHMLGCNPHPQRVQGSAAALPFADSSFDIAFEANLLHHVADPEAVLREIGRCSSRFLMLIEPNRWNPLMFGFGLLVKAERGLLRSSRGTMVRLVERVGFRIRAVTVTGMISQNNTPRFLISWLKRFDREIALGEYVVICGERA
jgi:SAM-dependent methyltransferase